MLIYQKLFYEKVLLFTQLSYHLMLKLLKKILIPLLCFYLSRDGIYVNNYHQNVNDPKVVASSARAETGLRPQSWISYLFNKIMRRRSQKMQRPSRYRRRQKLHKYANYVPYSPYRHLNHYMKRNY